MISLPTSGVKAISLWVIILVAFIGGLFSGFLGGGAGLHPDADDGLRPWNSNASGGRTDLFEIIISASYGTFSHAIKGNVDIMIAIGDAYRRRYWGADRRNLHSIFCGSQNPTCLRAAAVNRRCHRDLHHVDGSQNLAHAYPDL